MFKNYEKEHRNQIDDVMRQIYPIILDPNVEFSYELNHSFKKIQLIDVFVCLVSIFISLAILFLSFLIIPPTNLLFLFAMLIMIPLLFLTAYLPFRILYQGELVVKAKGVGKQLEPLIEKFFRFQGFNNFQITTLDDGILIRLIASYYRIVSLYSILPTYFDKGAKAFSFDTGQGAISFKTPETQHDEHWILDGTIISNTPDFRNLLKKTIFDYINIGTYVFLAIWVSFPVLFDFPSPINYILFPGIMLILIMAHTMTKGGRLSTIRFVYKPAEGPTPRQLDEINLFTTFRKEFPDLSHQDPERKSYRLATGEVVDWTPFTHPRANALAKPYFGFTIFTSRKKARKLASQIKERFEKITIPKLTIGDLPSFERSERENTVLFTRTLILVIPVFLVSYLLMASIMFGFGNSYPKSNLIIQDQPVPNHFDFTIRVNHTDRYHFTWEFNSTNNRILAEIKYLVEGKLILSQSYNRTLPHTRATHQLFLKKGDLLQVQGTFNGTALFNFYTAEGPVSNSFPDFKFTFLLAFNLPIIPAITAIIQGRFPYLPSLLQPRRVSDDKKIRWNSIFAILVGISVPNLLFLLLSSNGFIPALMLRLYFIHAEAAIFYLAYSLVLAVSISYLHYLLDFGTNPWIHGSIIFLTQWIWFFILFPNYWLLWLGF
ncbi:MAG: hypothetical protein D6732_04800 [Methanobacteriota archaeon]|nr:MAG: hypothetical protein D6732_04800 [Euryarchaeota archaeon]